MALNETSMSKGHVQDEDDVFIERLNTALFVFLGVVSISLSVIIIANSATVAVFSQRLPADFLDRSIVSAVSFVVGFGSLIIFRKRRESRKRKQSGLFLRTKA